MIHRGTNFSAFAPSDVGPDRVEKVRRTWLASPDERIVLLAARLTPWKGQRVLIKAAALLRDRGYRDLVFVLAGDAQGRENYVRELDALISDLNLDSIVRRVGHVTDMPAALAASALVAVPSTEAEAFGRVAVEAQAMGVPVVSPTSVPCPKPCWHRRRCGPSSAPAGGGAEFAEELAAALASALDMMPSAREALAIRARRHVEDQFSLEKMVSETLDCYTALLEAGPEAR